MTWFYYAIATAICWGVMYNIQHLVLQKHSPFSVFFITTVLQIIILAPLLLSSNLRAQSLNLITDQKNMFLLILSTVFVVAGVFSLYQAFVLKDPTTVSIVEITYPFFVALFAALFFTSAKVTWPLLVGGVLIFAGTAMVLYFGEH